MSKKVELKLKEDRLLMFQSSKELVKQLYNLNEEQYNKEVEKLIREISSSKKGKMKRRKGSTYELRIAKIIKDKSGVELVRTPLSGGYQKSSDREEFKGDLNLKYKGKLNIHLELKNWRKIRIKEWWRQVLKDLENDEETIPSIIYHVHQDKEQKAEEMITMRLSDFLDLIDFNDLVEE